MINIARSPINSSLTESFSGATTIRAYKMEENFIQVNERRIEDHQICYYPEIVSNSWLFSRLEILARYKIYPMQIEIKLFDREVCGGHMNDFVVLVVVIISLSSWII